MKLNRSKNLHFKLIVFGQLFYVKILRTDEQRDVPTLFVEKLHL